MKPAEDGTIEDDAVIVECDLDAPPEKVWRALTVPELVSRWLGAEEAGKEGRNDALCYEIVEAEPFSRLRYAWHDGDAFLPETQLTFELWARPGGQTRFRVTHAATARAPLTAANGNAPPLALAA